MTFESLLKQDVQDKAFEAQARFFNEGKAATRIDVFLFTDFCKAIQGDFRLEIADNDTGNAKDYYVQDALIDVESLPTDVLTYRLILKSKDNNAVETRVFDVHEIAPVTAGASAISHPKYYIYCNSCDIINFRFWFKDSK